MPAPSMSCMKNHGMRPAQSQRIYGPLPESAIPDPERRPTSSANQKQKMYIAGLMKNHAHDNTAPRLFFTSSNNARRLICFRHSQLSFNMVDKVLNTIYRYLSIGSTADRLTLLKELDLFYRTTSANRTHRISAISRETPEPIPPPSGRRRSQPPPSTLPTDPCPPRRSTNRFRHLCHLHEDLYSYR